MINIVNHFRSLRKISAMIILILCTAAIYIQTGHFDYTNYDDKVYVSENINVQKGLTIRNVSWAFKKKASRMGMWQPMVWLSYMAGVELFGMNPGCQHIINMLLHMANSIILFLVFFRMSECFLQSLFVAVLFAIHPIHVESVAWISERKDVLSTFFMMLTIWSYASYAQNHDFKKYLAVIVFFLMGLMSKPMLVTLPFALLLLDYWPLRRIDFYSDSGKLNINSARSSFFYLVREKVPLFVISLVFCLITYYAQNSSRAVATLKMFPIHRRLANVIVSYAMYLKKLFWPFDLAVFYPYPRYQAFDEVVLSGLVILLITLAAVKTGRRHPSFLTGWLWYLGMLFPVIGLVQFGSQAMADRYAYLPFIGIYMVIGWGVPDLLKNRSGLLKCIPCFAIVFSVVLIFLSWHQTSYWENSITLFSHDLETVGGNTIAYNNLGNALVDAGEFNAAVKNYLASIDINPDQLSGYYNLGNAYLAMGEFKKAGIQYLTVLGRRPEDAKSHNNLGVALQRMGFIDKAETQYRKTIKIDPLNSGAYNNLGLLVEKKGRIDEAIKLYKKAIGISPDFTDALYNLGNLLTKNGSFKKGAVLYSKIVKIDPKYSGAYNNLGVIYYKMGYRAKAKKLFKMAMSLDPENSDAAANIANLEKGQNRDGFVQSSR